MASSSASGSGGNIAISSVDRIAGAVADAVRKSLMSPPGQSEEGKLTFF